MTLVHKPAIVLIPPTADYDTIELRLNNRLTALLINAVSLKPIYSKTALMMIIHHKSCFQIFMGVF